jgi:hypothetical protein
VGIPDRGRLDKNNIAVSFISEYLPGMIAQAEIRQMTLPEKFALLETVEVPQWHKDILDQREFALQEGRATVLEWDEAKKQIDQAIR